MAGDFSDWYHAIPQMTRYWFTASVVLPLIGKIGIVSPLSMILNFEWVVYNFQIWRPVTALFYYVISPQTGFHYLINLYFLYSYSTRLETGLFHGRPADYLFLLIFNWIFLVLIGFVLKMALLMDPMILSVLYIWCQLNKDQIVTFWFGTQFKAMYLPWVLVAFNIIIRGGGLNELVGIVVGHLYFFLMFKYPQELGGRQFFSTPSILYKYFPNVRGGMSGFGVAPAARRQDRDDNRGEGPAGGHRWGGGNALGGN